MYLAPFLYLVTIVLAEEEESSLAGAVGSGETVAGLGLDAILAISGGSLVLAAVTLTIMWRAARRMEQRTGSKD